jgi:hypothetical protein
MNQTNLVQDVSVEIDAQTYTATYFIEGGAIHALVDGRKYRLSVGTEPADETVRALIVDLASGPKSQSDSFPDTHRAGPKLLAGF